LDTPAGAVRVRPRFARLAAEPAADRTNELAASGRVESEAGAPRSRVEAVAYVNVPSFVLHAGIPVKLPARTLRADVAYGGRFYAIVDSEAAGVGVDRPHAPELRRTGMAIGRAIESAYDISHPLDRTLRGIDGVVFTGPAAEADLRAATVFGSAQLSRSPSGTAAAAVIAVLDAMGLVAENGCVVHEGLIGTQFRCKIAGRTVLADQPAVIPEIEGSAWITGEHTLLADDSDPLADGFRL
jgi:proline racemase